MNYKTIYNYPKERQRIFYPWCYWDGAFTNEELDKMCAYFDTQGVERGTTVGNVEKDENGKEIVKSKPNEDVRLYTEYDLRIRLNAVLEENDCELLEADYSGENDFTYAGHWYTFATFVFKKK